MSIRNMIIMKTIKLMNVNNLRILLLIYAVLAFALFNTANAQVHMKGVNHLEINGGIYDSFQQPGYHAGIYFSRIKSNQWWWKIGFQGISELVVMQQISIPIAKYLASGTYYYTPGSLFNHRLYFNAGLGALAGYESINKEEPQVNESIRISDESKAVLGLHLEVNAEIFLNSKFIFVLGYSKRAMINSDISLWDDVYLTGLKFYIHP